MAIFYYHHIVFEWFSKICALPCMAFVIYRFFYGKPEKGWSSVTVREKYKTPLDAFNFFNFNYDKAVYDYKDKPNVIKGDVYDSLFRVYLLGGAFHYTFDNIVKVAFYRERIFTDKCLQVYLAHHLLTLFKFKSLWMLDSFPWFMAFPLAYHNFLVGIDLWINNIIYGISILCYFFIPLYHSNMRNNNVHRALMVKLLLIVIPIGAMTTMECRAMWDIEAMKLEK